MGYQDMVSKKAIETTKSRIMRRRSLYRSLARRGLVRSDPSLKQLDGSLYDGVRRFLGETGQESPAAGEVLNNWFEICVNIYADPELEEPPEWGKFIASYKRNLEQVDAEGQLDNSAIYRITDLLEEALTAFPMELMGVDDMSNDELSDTLEENYE